MNDTDELIGAYIDGELDLDAARDVERLIAINLQARRSAETFRQTSALLRAACGEQFYAASAPSLPPSGRQSRQHSSGRRRFLYATAASVATAAIFSGGMFVAGGFTSEQDALIDEIAEYHNAFSRETDHLVEVPASRVDELVSWLGSRLERHLIVPDLTGVGLRFAGGRMLVIDERSVAEFMYTRERGLPVAVCVARLAARPSTLRIDQRDRLRIASWNDGGYTYLVVGELDSTSARDIADRAAAQLRG